MKSRLMYIEKATGANHDGPAWIGMARFSKTGSTVYFDNKCFAHGWHMLSQYEGNYIELESGAGYWISGLKKNGQDRHRFGKGKIFIDKAVVEEYLAFRGIDKLNPQKYEIVEIIEIKTPADFYHLNNTPL